jgi:hypothetical protein
VVGLFAEVEVGHQRVLQQMHAAVADEDQRRGPVDVEAEGLGQHLQQRCGEHKPAPERHEIAQRTG